MEKLNDTKIDVPSMAGYIVRELKKKGADDVIVSVNSDDSSQLKFSNNKISTTQLWHSERLDLFMAMDKKLVSTSLREMSMQSADDLIKAAIKFSKSAIPNKEYFGIAKGPFTYNKIPETYDTAIAEIGDKAVDILNSAINTAMRNGAKRNSGVFETSVENSYLLTSNGVEAEEKGTQAYFSFRSFVDKYASGHQVCNSRVLRKLNPESSAEKAALIARQAINPKPGMPGTYDIIFSPLPFANILESIGRAASIFNVESGLSCFAGKLGLKVGNDNVTLVDDATLPNGLNSGMFDAEGVPSQRNILIQNGILMTYLHNTSTAKRYKTKTTASAGLVAPTPSNIIFEKGNFNKDEMVRQVKKGLIITNVWYTRFQNYATGDFSTIPRDGIFLIENGKVTGALKDIRINDNLIEILKKVSAIGNEQEPIYGWEVEIPTITPPVLVKDVKVTRSMD
jgi:PmbA protein